MPQTISTRLLHRVYQERRKKELLKGPQSVRSDVQNQYQSDSPTTGELEAKKRGWTVTSNLVKAQVLEFLQVYDHELP